MPFYESFDEFNVRMGCEHVFLRNRYLFSNGGTSDGDRLHVDPPADPIMLKGLKLEFLKSRLKKLTNTFNEMQTHLSETVAMRLRYQNAVSPPENIVETLKEVQAQVFQVRDAIKELETDETQLTEEQIRAKVAHQMEQEYQQRIQNLLTEASQISI